MIAAWLPAISSSTVVAALGFALSIPYRRWIESRIAHDFDRKLEEFRAGIRRDEENLRSELRHREGEIEALRSGALSNLTARHAELSRRRIQAVEAVWNYVVYLSRYKMIAKMAETINMSYALPEAAKRTSDGAKTRLLAETLWRTSNVDEIKKNDHPPDRERPFIPPITWAIFSVYRQVLSYPVVQLAAMRAGAGPDILAKPDELMVAIKTAMPELTAMIDEHREGAFPFVIDLLEQRLLRSLVEALEKPEVEDSTVKQAAQILAAVEAARSSPASPAV
jgi:hypothetical protein